MTLTAAPQTLVESYAQTYGIAPDQVNKVRLELSALKRTGTLVDITVGGVSRLFKRVSWQELGIPDNDKRAKATRRGTKPLFPEVYWRPIQSLEAQLRANLLRYSFDVQGFRPWAYVPATAYFTWLDAHNVLVEKFQAAIQRIVTDYALIREQVAAEWSVIADEAFDAMNARITLPQAREIWREHIVSKALGQLPTVDDLTDPETGLRVMYKTAMIETQASIIEDEIAISNKEIESQNLRADLDRVRQMKTIEKDLIAQQFKDMVSPFETVMQQLEGQIYADVQDVLDVIKKHGSLPGQTAAKARGVMELYRLMAVQSKPELEAALGQLQAALDTAPAKITGKKQLVYNANTIQDALSQIAVLTVASAKNALDAGVSRADMIDL